MISKYGKTKAILLRIARVERLGKTRVKKKSEDFLSLLSSVSGISLTGDFFCTAAAPQLNSLQPEWSADHRRRRGQPERQGRFQVVVVVNLFPQRMGKHQHREIHL